MKHLLLSMASMLLFLHVSLARSTSAKAPAVKENIQAVSTPLKIALPATSLFQQSASAATKRGCDGVDKKLINGVCEKGR